VKRCLVGAGGLLVLAVLAGGCTSEQMYGTGQNWQRNQCNRMPDGDERRECMARADVWYDDYAKRVGVAKAP
jgi:hypothetical protein